MLIESGGNVRAHVWVTGKVQGVFFRTHVRTQAKLIGLKGWVMNLDDGKVEAVFEGDRDSIDEILEFCKKGPEGSVVDNIEVKWEKITGSFTEFVIRYKEDL